MPILNHEAFAAGLPQKGALIGLDLGEKTIGLAVSDPGRRIGSSVRTLKRCKFLTDMEAISALWRDRGAVGFVIGWPLNMDGSEGPRCQATRAFVLEMTRSATANAALFGIDDPPVLLWDERLSTSAVDRMLVGDVDMTRKRRRQVVDTMAAAYILQGALDRLSMA